MVRREASVALLRLATQFKAVAVIGPRQSGKTTLVQHTFGHKPYVSMENPDTRQFALEDPRGFLYQFPNGAILDEAQRVPHLFSYLGFAEKVCRILLMKPQNETVLIYCELQQ